MDNAPIDNAWMILDEREGVGMVDTWTEYLCVSQTDDPNKIDVAICRSEIVGEIPAEWFDDEGQPLPEFSDGTGYLKLPEYYDGWAGRSKLTGHDGEYLLGGLVFDETYAGPFTVQVNDLDAISSALKNLGWVTGDLGRFMDTIQQIVITKVPRAS